MSVTLSELQVGQATAAINSHVVSWQRLALALDADDTNAIRVWRAATRESLKALAKLGFILPA